MSKLICNALLAMLVVGLSVLSVPVAQAGSLSGGIGVGGADCSDVKRQIRRDWMQLREFFRPGQKDLRRPRSREVVCISPYYTRDAMPVAQKSFDLTCYNVQGTKFCCDKRLEACAMM